LNGIKVHESYATDTCYIENHEKNMDRGMTK